MKQLRTKDDLTVLAVHAQNLCKLTKVAQKTHANLAIEERHIKAAEEWIGCCDGRLHNRNLSPKQRLRLEQQLERDQKFLESARLKFYRKNLEYPEVISEIEDVLQELAAIYAEARD